jgi:hypothetical protein
MKPLLSSLLLLFTLSLSAQAPVAVPIPKEPHHHLVLENSYVRVFRVSVPAHDATLLHQHDVPYLYVSLGTADVINAVQGKPEAHLVMADGQVGYSPGHFAHIARTDAGSSFDNVTIELLRPQGEPHNWCDKVVPSDPTDCRPSTHSGAKSVPSFTTNEIKVFSDALNSKFSTKYEAFSHVLFVVLNDSKLNVSFDRRSENLDSGQVLWIPSHANHEMRKLVFKNLRKESSHYLLIFFEDNAAVRKP